MSALEKQPDLHEPKQAPAEQAGIFYETYELGQDTGQNIFESTARIQLLEKSGRLIGVYAAPNLVTISFIAEKNS